MTRAIAYLRVSTDRQGDSVELQAAKVRAYCAMRELDLVEVVEDAAVSGSIPLAKRPAGRHLAEALKRHGATNVVALKLDRLFRDAADALGQTKAWDRGGISLHLCDMGGSAVDTSSPMGRMMVTMLSGFAEFERALIAERTRTALARKKELGSRTGSVPYGWKLCDNWRELDRKDPERKKLYRHEQEQIVIALVHELWAAAEAKRQGGMSKRKAKGSLRSICAELTARGLRSRKGTPFVSTQVSRMLKS